MKKLKLLFCIVMLFTIPLVAKGDAIEVQLTKSCNENNLNDCVAMAKIHSQRNEMDIALVLYRKSCRGGVMLGCTGEGAVLFRQDKKEEAITLFNKACENKQQDACDVLKKMSGEKMTSREQTLELLKLIGVRKEIERLPEELSKKLLEILTEKDKRVLSAKESEAFKKIIDEKIKIEKLLESIAVAYEANYSNPEIVAMSDFYKTPVGRKVVKVTPLLVGSLQKLTQEWTGNLLDNISVEMEKVGLKGKEKKAK